MGSRWHDWRELNFRSLSTEAAEHHRIKIRALIGAEFGDEPLIFVKDPRICRFVPFIASILDELNFTTVAILPIRNPLHVASSLKRRDNFTPSKSVLLWLRHVLDAERHSRHMRRAFVPYSEFLADWRNLITRATEKTGIAWPHRRKRADEEIDLFLRPGVAREATCLGESMPSQIGLLREAYNVVGEIAAGDETPDLLNRLDLVRMEFDEGCALFGAATAEDELRLEKMREQLGAQHLEIDSLHAEVRWRHGEIERLHKEVSRRDADIQQLHNEREQRDADIRSLYDEVRRRDADINWLHDEVRRRDTDIQWLHEEVKRRDAEIRQLHDNAQGRDSVMERLDDPGEVLTPANSAKPDCP
jgi:hypothetical protein